MLLVERSISTDSYVSFQACFARKSQRDANPAVQEGDGEKEKKIDWEVGAGLHINSGQGRRCHN